MCFSTIDLNKRYFIMPFGPTSITNKDVGLTKVPIANLYVDINGSKWRRCYLFNTGWGRPLGFERLPRLKFLDLLTLVLKSDYQNSTLSVREVESNQYGAASVIMDAYKEDLIDFLGCNIENRDLFENYLYQKNLKIFCFNSLYMKQMGGNGKYSYEEILNNYPAWREISKKVIELVYK
jgi:hypothetical protein